MGDIFNLFSMIWYGITHISNLNQVGVELPNVLLNLRILQSSKNNTTVTVYAPMLL